MELAANLEVPIQDELSSCPGDVLLRATWNKLEEHWILLKNLVVSLKGQPFLFSDVLVCFGTVFKRWAWGALGIILGGCFACFLVCLHEGLDTFSGGN